MKKVLLLSGYDASSHRHWRKLLEEELIEFDWTQLALPDRHFSWRARGNSLTFASQYLVRGFVVVIVSANKATANSSCSSVALYRDTLLIYQYTVM